MALQILSKFASDAAPGERLRRAPAGAFGALRRAPSARSTGRLRGRCLPNGRISRVYGRILSVSLQRKRTLADFIEKPSLRRCAAKRRFRKRRTALPRRQSYHQIDSYSSLDLVSTVLGFAPSAPGFAPSALGFAPSAPAAAPSAPAAWCHAFGVGDTWCHAFGVGATLQSLLHVGHI